MGDWLDQYSAALDGRDGREQAHKPFIDAFTKLADRTASSNITAATAASSPPPHQEPTPSKGKAAPPSPSPTQPPADLLQTLRADLASTQKARSTLQTQVTDLTTMLTTLQLQAKTSTAQISQLGRQKAEVERKLRDREEEIRGKARLVTEAQDEMIALGLQLNMSEQKAEKLKRDNEELLERWMRAKGEEAERMNRLSKWE